MVGNDPIVARQATCTTPSIAAANRQAIAAARENDVNPNDAADASADKDGDGYTNIEAFINGGGA